MDENIQILSDIIKLDVDGKVKCELIDKVKDLISENISLKRDIEKTKQDMEKSKQRYDLMDMFYKIAAEGANCYAQCYAIKHSSNAENQINEYKDIEFDLGKRPDVDTNSQIA